MLNKKESKKSKKIIKKSSKKMSRNNKNFRGKPNFHINPPKLKIVV